MKTTFLSALGGLLILLIMKAAGASACTICYPMPETTLADRLLASEVLVSVREKIGKPYTFEVVRLLRGKDTLKEIDVFIDAASRSRLTSNPGDVVFLSRNGNREYRFFAYGTPQIQKLVDTILDNSTRWQTASGREERYQFFLPFLHDPDPVIREQAYLEVSRAPYPLLKGFAREVDRATIHGFLAKERYVEWHPLYILLLGHSHHQEDREHITSEFLSLAKHGLTTNLAAWTTAYIESQSLDSEQTRKAVTRLSELYFARGDRSHEELEEVLKGLSVLGIINDDELIDRQAHETIDRLRRSLVEGYQLLLENHPSLAGAVARHLASWRVNALTDQLRAINEQGAEIDEGLKLALESYLAVSSGFARLRL